MPMTDTTLAFEVKQSACKRCALCVKDCPANLLELDASGFPAVVRGREDTCIGCQHCLAICPEGAISVNGMRPENSLSIVAKALPKFEQMNLLVRARRSVRQYRHEDVDPNLIQRLLDALAHSPTGVNARGLTFTVVSERTALSKL